MKRLFLIACVATFACINIGAQPREAAQTTLIKNATVLTVSRGTLQNTDVLIRNGKIATVGQNLSAPTGARVIDATGKFVLPGIIDAHSHTMMDGSVNECTKSVTSMARTQDVLNPNAINIYRGLAGGTTSALLLHGSCNAIGGLSTDGQVQVGTSRGGLHLSRRADWNQVRARRESEAHQLQHSGFAATLSRHAHGR